MAGHSNWVRTIKYAKASAVRLRDSDLEAKIIIIMSKSLQPESFMQVRSNFAGSIQEQTLRPPFLEVRSQGRTMKHEPADRRPHPATRSVYHCLPAVMFSFFVLPSDAVDDEKVVEAPLGSKLPGSNRFGCFRPLRPVLCHRGSHLVTPAPASSLL